MFPSRRILTIPLTFLVAVVASEASASSRVSTTSGTLNGFYSGNVTTFLGIPYAQPPVGDLRWRTALPINASGTEVNATQFGPVCGQLLVPGWGSVYYDIIPLPATQSEDCLSLNIWSPRDGQKLPVIIFVHGGGYQSGGSPSPIYYGDHIASTGRAIFVTLNYRMNVWGFPSTTPIDGVDQNIGITDVRLAIEWVSRNIEQFGGDPAQITLAGHSAGASLGEALLYAYEEDPIVVGHIPASGALGTIDASPTDGASWNFVADSFGCGNITNSVQISCMRNASFENINNITLELQTYFGPTSDGSVIFTNEEYVARGANGSFAHVPALITNVDDEGSLLVEPYGSIYPNGTTADFASDTLVCPAAVEASDKRRAGVPAWRARYLAVWPNLEPFPEDPSVGAYHGSDLPLYLGTYKDLSIGNGTATNDERLLSSRLMDAWLTFAENPGNGLLECLGWPLYDPEGDTLIKMGENNTSSITFGPSTQYDSTCPA